jgi:O-antigen/teichoic acid export membrane protein
MRHSKRATSGRFWTNVASVLSGTAVAQAIPIVGSLVLTRLFIPAASGSYSVWLGYVLVHAVIATMRLDMALAVIPDGAEREEAAGLVLATIVAVGLVAAAIGAPVCLAGWLPAAAGTPLLAGLAVFAAIAASACDAWQGLAAADGTYRVLIKIRIAQAFLVLAAQVGASFVSRDAQALMLGHVAGLALTVALAALSRPISLPRLVGMPHRLAGFWRDQSRFPLFALPADAINTISAQLPLLVVSARFGDDSAGVLALTMRVLGAPIGLLGKSVLDVFRRHAAEGFRERGECQAEYRSTFKVLAAGSLLFVICTFLFAEPIFAFAFGEKWRLAGTIAIWLAPLFALRFVASPLSYVFYIVGRQNIDLAWQVGLLAVIVSALMVPPDLRETLLWYGYGYSAMYFVYLFLSYRCSKGRGS